MNSRRVHFVLLVLLGIALMPSPAAAQTVRPAVVTLKPHVMLNEGPVRLKDVADIKDSQGDRRTRLEGLDLADAVPAEVAVLDRSFIELRIRLAGFGADAVQVGGANQVRMNSFQAARLSDLGVEQAVLRTLSRQFSIAEDDLHVKLMNPFIDPKVFAVDQLAAPHIELVPPTQLPLGRVQLTVRVLDGDRIVLAKQATFEIARRQSVIVATASLDRSSVISADYVREETRFVDSAVDSLQYDHVASRKLTMPVRPGEILTLRHLTEVREQAAPIVVNARDPVRIIAKRKGLTFTVPMAEAMQSGRVGQLIRVRNVESNRIVTARITGSGEVEVILD